MSPNLMNSFKILVAVTFDILRFITKETHFRFPYTYALHGRFGIYPRWGEWNLFGGKIGKISNPKRWIKEGRIVSGYQFKYVVFNASPRLWVGKKFAYTQMKMVAAAILMRHSVKVVEGKTVVPKLTTTLYMKNGLRVTLQPHDW